jgi:hypothetical protein
MWYSAVGSIVTLTLSLLAAPLAAGAQPAGKVWRIGVLTGGADPESPRGASFRQGLRELGYVEGQNIAIEWLPAEAEGWRYACLFPSDTLAWDSFQKKVEWSKEHPFTPFDSTTRLQEVIGGGREP